MRRGLAPVQLAKHILRRVVELFERPTFLRELQ
jgi:hypothetical protein